MTTLFMIFCVNINQNLIGFQNIYVFVFSFQLQFYKAYKISKRPFNLTFIVDLTLFCSLSVLQSFKIFYEQNVIIYLLFLLLLFLLLLMLLFQLLLPCVHTLHFWEFHNNQLTNRIFYTTKSYEKNITIIMMIIIMMVI